MYEEFNKKRKYGSFILPLRLFDSLDPLSSVQLARLRLCRKNFSGKNEKLGNLSVNSNVRFVGGGTIVVGVVNVLVGRFITVVGGMAAVASGRMPIADVVSIGRTRAGFLINDKNRCRHKSSGISELSTSNSRNCRNP